MGVSSSNEKLINATRSGDTRKVTQLIDASADVNLANKDGNTPFYWASI